MTEPQLVEIRDLLREIRELLVPIAGASEEAYAAHERRKALAERVGTLISTDRRRRAWLLADGSRTQRQIARESGLDEGNASKFFKTLRDLQAISDDANPTRSMEVDV